MHFNPRSLVKRVLPKRLAAEISAYRWWAHIDLHQDREIARRVTELAGIEVIHGPFKGLRLTPQHLSTHFLLGTYEIELHRWFESSLRNSYERVLDIGAGEGYYAVGLAMRTRLPVEAYDAALQARRRCRHLADLNRVDVKVKSWCDRSTLRGLHRQRCLILSDCEGYEVNLFTRESIVALAESDLIIELHGDARQYLQERFSPTHRLEFVELGSRDPKDFPHLAFLPEELARQAINEGARGSAQEWMLATPK